MQSVLPILLATLAVATVTNVFLRRFDIPTIVGYIATGTLLGHFVAIDHGPQSYLEHVAEFGIVFLMFIIGLEFSPSQLRTMRREVFLFGFLQVGITGACIALGAVALFGIAPLNAAIVGSALALSSTAIVLKILNETGRTKSAEGRNSVGILIFQDIAVIPILVTIGLVSGADTEMSSAIGKVALNAALLILATYVAGRYVIKWLFKVISDTNSKEIYTGSILLIAIGASYFAHHLGFSYSLGGFLAGMMIADTIYKYQIEADLIPFRDIFLGVFFVSVGLQIDLAVVATNLAAIALLCLSLMAIKGLVLFAILIPFQSQAVALKTAVNLAQIGEFALVVLSLMLGNRLMAPDQVQILIVTVVISMIVTPILMNHTDTVLRMIFKAPAQADPADSLSLISGHVVLLGYGNLGQTVSQLFDQSEIPHVIVTDATDEYVKARELGKMVVFGDPSDRVLLRKVGIADAMSTIIAVEDIETVKRTSAAIRLIDPSIGVIARVSTEAQKREIDSFEHELVLDGNTSAATLIVDQIKRSRVLARESSEIRYMKNIAQADLDEAIAMIVEEQKRLLALTSKSFNGLRNQEDIMQLKAYHESFEALAEIIDREIKNLSAWGNASPQQYDLINTLLDNQDRLVAMNAVMKLLGRELQALGKVDATRDLAEIAVEGLDAMLLTLIALAVEYNDGEMRHLQAMTSAQSKGFAGVRGRYADRTDGVEDRALLLSATNHMDRLRALFGEVGNNYRKFAETQAGSAAVVEPQPAS